MSAERQSLIAALRFYADPDSYGLHPRRVRPVISDGGLLARIALRGSPLDDLRQIDRAIMDAHLSLTLMRVTTEPMRPDEMTDIEQRRVTALGYLDQVLDVLDDALRSRTVVRDGRRDV